MTAPFMRAYALLLVKTCHRPHEAWGDNLFIDRKGKVGEVDAAFTQADLVWERTYRTHRHTGYLVGGISPFGRKKKLRIYVEETILSLPRIFINAGRKGLLFEMSPADLIKVLQPIPVDVAR